MRRDPETDLPSEDELRALSDRTTDEIEDDIVRIRAAMDQTLSAIEGKLDATELMRRVQSYLTAGPGEFGANLSKVLKENPIPVLMVGIGLAWLGWAGVRQKSREIEKIYLDAYERFERKRRRRQSWNDLSHAAVRLRGKMRRARKEAAVAAEPERRHRARRRSATRRKEGAARIRTPLMSSLGAVVGAAFSAALSKRL